MGKPYASDLRALPSTYSWCTAAAVDELVSALAPFWSMPLVAVGSGGSLSAAYFAADLHQRYTGQVAKAVTPLELVSSSLRMRDLGLLFLSAGGRNPDIIGAFEQAILREPRHIAVLCFDPHSPLADVARNYSHVDFISFDLPSRKDGFLATNTLLADALLLARAYEAMFNSLNPSLPGSLDALLQAPSWEEWGNALRERCEPLWERDTLVVLFAPSTHPAAIDIESKFTEAALGTVQLADYRNFAHGRHYWLATKGKATAVLALVTNDERKVAQKVLRLIPAGIPIVSMDLDASGVHAALAALVSSICIAGLVGAARGVDPGAPRVPAFGRRIYHTHTFGSAATLSRSRMTPEVVAISRKAGVDPTSQPLLGEASFWRDAYKSFVSRLEKATYPAVAIDYDGTLCDRRQRYSGLGRDVAEELTRLLKAGVALGIATGRGESVRSDLRRQITPSLWPRILVGYYSGGDIGLLDDDAHPVSPSEPCHALSSIAAALRLDGRLKSIAECRCRHTQISVRPRPSVSAEALWDIVQHLAQSAAGQGVTIVRSGHSVDILAPGVSKRLLIQRLRERFNFETAVSVLCIGDKGRWPGNDFALLAERYSLSVDEVSPDPDACWNLAPPGYRGVSATLSYLRALEIADAGCRIDTRRISRFKA